MGKAGRIACIFSPMALTIAALVTLVLVGLGGTNKGDSTLEKYYFFKVSLVSSSLYPSSIFKPRTNCLLYRPT
jgi:hypothetical protein